MDVGILFFVVIMATMLLFAVLSNGLVIYCVVKIKKLRTITNVFICNLSVSDILLAGFIMPQKLHDISHKEDFFEGMLLSLNIFPVFFCFFFFLIYNPNSIKNIIFVSVLIEKKKKKIRKRRNQKKIATPKTEMGKN